MGEQGEVVTAYLERVPEWRLSKRARARLLRIVKMAEAMPEVWLEPFGERHLAIKVRKKTFAYYLNEHHDDGKIGVCVKSTLEEQRRLVRKDAKMFYVPAYLGPSGWVGVRVDLVNVEWEVLKGLIEEGFRMVAPKRVVEALDSGRKERA